MRPLSSLTPFELATVTDLIAFQTATQEKQELLICVSADGTAEVGRNKGTINRVDLPKEAEDLLKQQGSIRLFHNHPKQGSLSAADWRQSNRWMGRADLVAGNTDGSIFCGAAVRSGSRRASW